MQDQRSLLMISSDIIEQKNNKERKRDDRENERDRIQKKKREKNEKCLISLMILIIT